MLHEVQDAAKFARHGLRTRLRKDDVTRALKTHALLCDGGLHPWDRRRFVQLAGAPGCFRVAATLHSNEAIMHQPLPAPPSEAGLQVHWLLIGGVKPRTPENMVPRRLVQHFQQRRVRY